MKSPSEVQQESRWQVLTDAAAVADRAVGMILDCAQRSVAERGVFLMVLAGGRTPLDVYRRLADLGVDSGHWELFFGDERCLPPGHPERNDEAARQAWFEPAVIPANRIHPMPAESGPVAGAAAYEREIRSWLPFDLVLLGIGEDGHVASLFPGDVHPAEPLVVAVTDAAKPPPNRVSLNYSAICGARQRLLLATGSGKRAALGAWRSGEKLPAALVGECGPMTVLMDEAAAP